MDTIATAIAATVADASVFSSGREFAAWLGLVPRQSSTGGKARLGGISKRGDSYLRRLLINSAHTVLLCSKAAKVDPWVVSLCSRRPRLVVAVAWQIRRHVWLGRSCVGRIPIDASQRQHDPLNCRASVLARAKSVMAQSVDPTDREKPDRLRGLKSRPTDKASTRGIHQGQRFIHDRTERPDT